MRAAVACFLLTLQIFLLYFLAFEHWSGPSGTLSNELFLPSVMIAAGRGFSVVEVDAVPELRAFMNYERRTFSLSEIPDDLPASYPNEPYQWHRYMIWTVGVLWRVFGVSWNVFRGFSLVFLFMAAAAVYGIARLALPRGWSLFVAHAFVWNTAVLATVGLFRDFSKAPFILTAIGLLGWLIKTRPSVRRYLCVAALLGGVLGFGMGFRRDMAAVVLLSAPILLSCRLESCRRPILSRAGAAAILLAMFAVVSLPILLSLYPMRWTNAHDAAMGLSSRCEQELGTLTPSSCEKQYLSHDVYTTFQMWASAQHGLSMSEAAYERTRQKSSNDQLTAINQAYLRTAALLFPADMLTRAYAATLRCIAGLRSKGIFPYVVSNVIFPVVLLERFGLILVAFGLLIIAASDPYKAWQVLLTLLLFCGCTSLQFGMRHAFHLTFIPYWFGCFVLHRLWSLARGGFSSPPLELAETFSRGALLRMLAWVLATSLILYVPVTVAEYVQRGQVMDMLASYRQADRMPTAHVVVPKWEGETLMAPKDPYPCRTCEETSPFPQYRHRILEARFRAPEQPLDLKLVYESEHGGWNFSSPLWTHFRLGAPTEGVSVYFSVYETIVGHGWSRFVGVLMPDSQAPLFEGFHQLADLGAVPFYLVLTAPDNSDAFEPLQGLRLPWPRQRPIDYPWPVDPYLYPNDDDIKGCFQAGDAARARSLAEAMLERRPGSVHFRAYLAQALLQENSWEDARRVLEQLLADYPEDYAVYQRLDMAFEAYDGLAGRCALWGQLADAHPSDACAKAHLDRAMTARDAASPQ